MSQSIMDAMPKLLIVDDDNLILDCFHYAFPPDQVAVTTATSVAEAMSLFRQHSFDAVVTDIRLTDSSGLQLLQELQSLDGRIPVILMTGHGTAKTAIDAMRNGAIEYLLKPLDLDVLQAVINRAFEASRMARTCQSLR